MAIYHAATPGYDFEEKPRYIYCLTCRHSLQTPTSKKPEKTHTLTIAFANRTDTAMAPKAPKESDPLISSTKPTTATATSKSPYSGPLHIIACYGRITASALFRPYILKEFFSLGAEKVLPRKLREYCFGVDNYEPDNDVPDQTGKVFIVTGGNTGLGLVTVTELAKHGAKVYMASRTESKAREAIAGIKEKNPNAQVEFLHLDLNSLTSVKQAAEDFLSREQSLHVLLNNAGVMATPVQITEDGLEAQWQANYVGHALFTRLLLPILERTAATAPKNSVRIVNVTSSFHRCAVYGICYEDINLVGSSTWARYGQSKLANVLHAQALAKRYAEKGIVVLTAHPGIIYTNLFNPFRSTIGTVGHYLVEKPFGLILRTLREGAFNSIAGCTSPEVTVETHSGAYIDPVLRIVIPDKYAQDPENAEKLYYHTEALFREKGF